MRKAFILVWLVIPWWSFGQTDTLQVDTSSVQLDEAVIIEQAFRGIPYQRGCPPGQIQFIVNYFPDGFGVKIPENPLQLSTSENLNLIPGIAAFDGTAGTSKFSYRGLGTRSQYTTSRSLIYLDDIPITSIQGFSTFEDFNPFWISSYNLHEDAGVWYPSALGGVLKYHTQNGFLNMVDNGITSQLNVGSFGLLQTNTAVWLKKDHFSLFTGYENTYKQGWRENNELGRQSFIAKPEWKVGQKKQYMLSLLLYGIKARVEIPSSVDSITLADSPESAGGTWGVYEGFKEYNRFITALSLEERQGFLWNSFKAYYRYYDNNEARPFNLLDERRHSTGFRVSSMSSVFYFLKSSHYLKAFAEYQLGNESTQTYQNLYDSINGTYNNKGGAIAQTEILGQRLNGGVNMRSSYYNPQKARAKWFLDYGFNMFYQYNKVVNAPSDSYDIPFEMAPNFKFTYSDFEYFRIYTQLYKSYSIPALEENLDPNGNLNRNLLPEKAWNGELGFLWLPVAFNTRHEMKIEYYYMVVKNLIIPQVIGPDQVIAKNSGSSQHTGVELSISNQKKKNLKWIPFYTLGGFYGSFKYLEFSDTSRSFSGNKLPGFPDWQVNGSFEITYNNQKSIAEVSRDSKGPNVKCTFGLLGRYSSGYFVNDENTVSIKPYFLLQSWVKAEYELSRNWKAALNLGLRNITDTHYASMTVVNNQGFGGAPRYYYPGEPLNWFGGISFTYLF